MKLIQPLKHRKHGSLVFVFATIIVVVTGLTIHKIVSPPEIEIQNIAWSVQQNKCLVRFVATNKTAKQLDVDFVLIAYSGFGGRFGIAVKGQSRTHAILYPHDERQIQHAFSVFGNVSLVDVIPGTSSVARKPL